MARIRGGCPVLRGSISYLRPLFDLFAFGLRLNLLHLLYGLKDLKKEGTGKQTTPEDNAKDGGGREADGCGELADLRTSCALF